MCVRDFRTPVRARPGPPRASILNGRISLSVRTWQHLGGGGPVELSYHERDQVIVIRKVPTPREWTYQASLDLTNSSVRFRANTFLRENHLSPRGNYDVILGDPGEVKINLNSRRGG